MHFSQNSKIDFKPSLHDLALIEGGFVDYLRERHASAFTIRLYSRFLLKVAWFLAKHGRRVTELNRQDTVWVMRGCLPGWKDVSRRPRLSGLNQWLRFIGRFDCQSPSRASWHPWIKDYACFLRDDRALAACTQSASLRVVGRYMAWQFKDALPQWDCIGPEQLCRYVVELRQTLCPRSINDTLSILRQFFRFIHLRGAGPLSLVDAVPCVADYARGHAPEVLDGKQRRRLLASFDRNSAQGRRDYAIVVCLIDLGLRAIEVARLRLDSIDWQGRSMRVPAAKAGQGRQLPLPDGVLMAFREYLKVRPRMAAEHFFVGQSALAGRALSSCAICAVVDRAYRRCGMKRLFGTHRLRHSFATRLFARGCTLKEIADLLGHRRISTTDRYTQVKDMRFIAQPWPE